MKPMKPWGTGLAALLIAGSLSATTAQAYELSKQEYQAMEQPLPAWDHDGRLPEGHSRDWELKRIDEEAAYRQLVLASYEHQLPDVIEQSKSNDGAEQARRDVESQQATYRRWQESAERRKEAIIKAQPAEAGEETESGLYVPPTPAPEWAAADSAHEAQHPKMKEPKLLKQP